MTIAHTNFAKNKIRKFLIRQNADYVREESVKRGRQALVDALRERKINIDVNRLITKKVLDAFNAETVDDLLIMVNNRNVPPYQVIDESEEVNYSGKKTPEEIAAEINSRKIKKNSSDVVILSNGDTIMTSLANCCTPIPGDDIIGFVSTGQGVKIHRKDCPNVNRPDNKERLIDVMWNPECKTFSECLVDIAIECHDRNNLLIDVLNSLASFDAKVMKVNAKFHPSNNTTTISATLLVRNKDELGHFMHCLLGVKSVYQVRRVFH